MLISTKGRYALRVMIDLAQNKESGHVAMKIVAARQGISLKYLERILPVLTKNGLIEGVHGKGGGYRLCREPKEYKAGESFVLRRETLLRSHAWNAMHLSVKEKISVTQLECGLIFTK